MLAQRLKAARLAKGLTQDEVARRIGVQQRFVSKLERGDKRPNVEMLSKLAKLYDVSESDLLKNDTWITQGHVVNGDGIAQGHIVNGGSAEGHIVNVPQAVKTGLPGDGLADLEADTALLETLQITPEEWAALRTIELPGPTDKAGFIQLLATIRGITRG